MSELTRRLKEVDPNLRIVPAFRRPRKQAQKAFAACGGAYCPRCKAEAVRFINGLCPTCDRDRRKRDAEKLEDKALRRYYRSKLKENGVSPFPSQ